MRGLWLRYSQLLNRRPLLTVSVTTGVLMGTGDAISQFAIEGKSASSYDVSRSCRFVVFGTLIGGPAFRGWYATLERLVPSSVRAAPLKKMLLDQSLFAPSLQLTFWSVMSAMKGYSGAQIQDTLRQNFLPVLKVNYLIWPAAQLLNFYLVPVQFRVLYVNVVSLGWNTFVAWRSEYASVQHSHVSNSDTYTETNIDTCTETNSDTCTEAIKDELEKDKFTTESAQEVTTKGIL